MAAKKRRRKRKKKIEASKKLAYWAASVATLSAAQLSAALCLRARPGRRADPAPSSPPASAI